jgi:hypothetical protein
MLIRMNTRKRLRNDFPPHQLNAAIT